MQSALHRTRRIRDLGGGSFALEVDGAVPETRPGQFFMLRTELSWPVLLPRPFSLADRWDDGDGGSFLVKPVGPGTRRLGELQPGDGVWLTGPLGRPFPDDVADPVCVAGGVGLAPFLLLARAQRCGGRQPLRLLFGGQTRAALAGLDDFAELARTWTSTDDGSHGRKGLVTDLLRDLLASGDVRSSDVVFCCGPDRMMDAVADLCAEHGMRCLLSLETYMGCGYGVCNGCTVQVQGPRFGGWPFSKSCIEGPVYDAAELVRAH